MARNPLIRNKPVKFKSSKKNKSAGILDDFALRKTIDTKQGTIDSTPTAAKDLVNKEYVDAQIAGENHWDDNGTQLQPYNSARSLKITGTTDSSFAGNVGIGTSSPQQKLHISGGSLGIDNNQWILWNNTAGSSFSGGIKYDSSDNLRFDTNGAQRMTIDSSGNVGIGTTSPSGRLHVIGATDGDGIIIGDESGSARIVGWNGTAYNPLDIRTTGGAGSQLFLNTDGNVGIGTSSPDELFSVKDQFLVDTNGLTTWKTAGGLPYGSCWGNEIAWTQASAVQNTWYLISDADMTDGQLLDVTHDGSGKLTVATAGKYLINYSWAGGDSANNDHVQIGIAVNGTTGNDGMTHFETAKANDHKSAGSTAILNLAANDTIEIAIRTTDAVTPDLDTDHLNISIVHIGA